MNKELEQYFEDMFEMFSTRGWKLFVEDFTLGKADKEKVAARSADHDELMKIRGELAMMDLVSDFEQAIRNQYEAAKAEDDADV